MFFETVFEYPRSAFWTECNDFESLGGRFGLQIGCLNQACEIRGPSEAKNYENGAKMVAQGCLWEHPGALKGLLGRSWEDLTLESVDVVFLRIV